MEWLFDNWIIVALFGGMAAMHLVGHRRGGGHGCCGGGHDQGQGHDHGQGQAEDCCGKKDRNAEDVVSK